MTRLLLALALLPCLAPVALHAQGSQGWSTYDAPGDQPPEVVSPDQLLRQGIDRLTGFMMGGGASQPALLRSFLAQQVAPYFDFEYMARWAAGGFYRRLDETQRAAMARQLRDLFLGALARNLGAYALPLPEVQVLSARIGRSAHEALVPARVLLPAGVATRLEFRFYWTGQAWRVFDVTANGASAVAFYRNYYADQLRRYGPDILTQ